MYRITIADHIIVGAYMEHCCVHATLFTIHHSPFTIYYLLFFTWQTTIETDSLNPLGIYITSNWLKELSEWLSSILSVL